MTCCDFRSLLLSKDITAITRGERAAYAHHLRGCPVCCEWLGCRPVRLFPDAEALAARDAEDPEYREVAFGEVPAWIKKLAKSS